MELNEDTSFSTHAELRDRSGNVAMMVSSSYVDIP